MKMAIVKQMESLLRVSEQNQEGQTQLLDRPPYGYDIEMLRDQMRVDGKSAPPGWIAER